MKKPFTPLLLLAAVLAITTPLKADDLSSNDIVDALDPHTAKKKLTRSWVKRGVTVQKGEEKNAPPSIDLYVNFAYDSADLLTDSQIVLDNLALALKDQRLSTYTFLVAGHTDSKGPDDYNLTLSMRRAHAVVTYLASKYGIEAARLKETGFGEAQLLDPQNPEDGINRRVQIVNLSEATKE